MKKRAAPLFLAVLTACALACPAMAAEAPSPETTPSVLYPVEVLEYTEGDRAEPRISKTYELSPMDDPALIPTGDFERSGCLYTLLDIVKEDQTETDSKYYTETVTLDSKSKDMEEIMPLLAATCEAVTEDAIPASSPWTPPVSRWRRPAMPRPPGTSPPPAVIPISPRRMCP